jgi:hypothetical protein
MNRGMPSVNEALTFLLARYDAIAACVLDTLELNR